MKREGFTLIQAIKNKTGAWIAFFVIITSLLVAVIVSFCTSLTIKQALMVSSGFGWYSFSGIINANFLGTQYGIMSFLLDFSRELFVLTITPFVAKQLQEEIVGAAGSTSVDFTLPIIKDSYGIQMMAPAVSSGFILSIATPLFIFIFNLIL